MDIHFCLTPLPRQLYPSPGGAGSKFLLGGSYVLCSLKKQIRNRAKEEAERPVVLVFLFLLNCRVPNLLRDLLRHHGGEKVGTQSAFCVLLCLVCF